MTLCCVCVANLKLRVNKLVEDGLSFEKYDNLALVTEIITRLMIGKGILLLWQHLEIRHQ